MATEQSEAGTTDPIIVRARDDFRWESVPVLAYKETGRHFRNITRQILFDGDPALPVQWRYFEIADGGHSTLERHDHLHVVMIIRGVGQALVGDRVLDVGLHDVVRIPAMTWHQFRATAGAPLGFLCVVHIERDRPILPDDAAIAELRANPRVAEFIRL